MKVHFIRSGGFVGKTWELQLDTESLSEEETRRLRELVEAADFFNLPPVQKGRPGVADDMEYVVTVDMDGKRHTVRTKTLSGPERLQELLAYLSKAAKKRAADR